MLKRVAQVLRENCPGACTAARYGGEEFALICPGLGARDITALAEQMRGAIEASPWPERRVTISIGGSILTPITGAPADLVTIADSALYQSKAEGRNRVTIRIPNQFAQERLAS